MSKINIVIISLYRYGALDLGLEHNRKWWEAKEIPWESHEIATLGGLQDGTETGKRLKRIRISSEARDTTWRHHIDFAKSRSGKNPCPNFAKGKEKQSRGEIRGKGEKEPWEVESGRRGLGCGRNRRHGGGHGVRRTDAVRRGPADRGGEGRKEGVERLARPIKNQGSGPTERN
jgi:hypothetical protein